MGKKCAAVMIVGLMLGGCTSHEPEKPPTTAAASSVAASVYSDDFGLPLVISIDAPEVPAELQGPSPPIKEESASH